jgi:hypothetical protein
VNGTEFERESKKARDARLVKVDSRSHVADFRDEKKKGESNCQSMSDGPEERSSVFTVFFFAELCSARAAMTLMKCKTSKLINFFSPRPFRAVIFQVLAGRGSDRGDVSVLH